ncbi:hypothetical protein ACA910_018892 [Epithemia clementina (nom. ined.)]
MVHEQPLAGKRVAESPPSEGPIPTPNKRQAVGKGDSTHAPKKLEVEVIEDVGIPTVKATKLDDAVIPVFMWDVPVREGMTWLGPEASVFDRAIVVLCRWLHQLWLQRVVSSFWDWWKVKFCIPGLQLTEEGVNAFKVGQRALAHPSMSSWWDWDKGSSPFFWRFPDEWEHEMRVGLAPHWLKTPPTYTRRQQNPSDPNVREKEKSKLAKFGSRATSLH